MSALRLNSLVRKSDIAVVGVLLAIVAILAGARSVHYLLFHTMAELFAIVVSLSIFILTWASNRYLTNGYLIVLGASYGAIGLVDIFHTLTFKGMNLFPGVSTNYPTQFWLTARYLEAIALLLGPLVIARRPRFAVVSAGFAAIALGACAAVMLQWFPATFIDGIGLTPFKVYSEYLIIALLIAGFVLLYRCRRQFETRIFLLLAGSLWLAVATEFCFTRYASFYDVTNALGHYFRFLSVALAFIAVVLSGVRQPFDLIFREMQEDKRLLVDLNEKLTTSEDRLNRAQHVAEVGSWQLDLDSQALTWSPETYRMFGEPLGTPQSLNTFARFIHPDDREAVMTAWNMALQSGLAYDIEHRIIVDDQIRWVRERAEITMADDGSPQAGIGTVQEISERKRAEAALRESEERYRTALVALAEGVFVYDRQGALITINPAAERILGLSAEEFRERSIDDGSWRIVRSDGAPFPSDEWPSVFTLRTGIPQREVPMGVVKPDGSVTWILVSTEPIRDTLTGELQAVAASFNDITARKAAEEALQISLVAVQRHDAQMVALNRMNDLLLSCETSKDAYRNIARSAEHLFSESSGALAVLPEDAAANLRVVATWGGRSALPGSFPLHDCWAVRHGEIHAVTDPARGVRCGHFCDPPPPPYLCIPLTVRHETLGLLHLSARQPVTEAQFGSLRILAIAVSESIKLALSNIRLQEALREQAIRDPLTGLFNRRYLDETLPRELASHQRRGEPLAVAMLDLDHFKHFNDTYGHEAGDTVLRAIGALLNRSLRAGDLACRYGGEELTLILPGASLDNARTRLEGLRQAIMQLRILHHDRDLPPITVSIGVAAGGQETDATALLGRADTALYLAKGGGRNRIMAASTNLPETDCSNCALPRT